MNKQTELEALIARAESELDDELDGEIHDLLSAQASAINNGGVTEQIDYIVENYGSDYAIQVLKDVLPKEGASA